VVEKYLQRLWADSFIMGLYRISRESSPHLVS
jgi:hypothetical protein